MIAFLTIFLEAASPRSMPHISANLMRYRSTSDSSSPRCSLSDSSQFGNPFLLHLFGSLFWLFFGFFSIFSPFSFSLVPSPPLSFVPLPLLPSLFSFPDFYLHFSCFFTFAFCSFLPSPSFNFFFDFLLYPLFSPLPAPPSSIPPPPPKFFPSTGAALFLQSQFLFF